MGTIKYAYTLYIGIGIEKHTSADRFDSYHDAAVHMGKEFERMVREGQVITSFEIFEEED